MFAAKYTRYIRIVVPAGFTVGQIVPFPQDQEINLKPVQALETYENTILARTPDNEPVVSQAGGAEVVLYLYQENMARFYAIPYNSFNTQLNAGIVRQLKDLKINLQKSYIQITGNVTIAAGQALVFSFMYENL